MRRTHILLVKHLRSKMRPVLLGRSLNSDIRIVVLVAEHRVVRDAVGGGGRELLLRRRVGSCRISHARSEVDSKGVKRWKCEGGERKEKVPLECDGAPARALGGLREVDHRPSTAPVHVSRRKV